MLLANQSTDRLQSQSTFWFKVSAKRAMEAFCDVMKSATTCGGAAIKQTF